MLQGRSWSTGVLSFSLLLLGLHTAALPCSLPAQETPKPTDAHIAALIDDLKHLPTSFDRKQFLGRRAMSELFIYGPYSFPKLKIAALSSEDWSVAISAAYLCSLLTSLPDYDIQRSLLAMTQHEQAHVRVAASSLLIYGETGIAAKELLGRPIEAQVREQLQLAPMDFSWLSDSELLRWTRLNLLTVATESALADPPAWNRNPGPQMKAPDVKDVLSAGERKLAIFSETAKIGLANAIRSAGRGHLLLEDVVASAESSGDEDAGRIGLSLKVLGFVLEHNDIACGDQGCKLNLKYAERIAGLCEKWLSISQDAWVLNAAVNTLAFAAGVGSQKAMELLEQLEKNHSLAQLRILAGKRLGTIKASRSRESAGVARREEARNAAKNRRAEIGKPLLTPSTPTKPTGSPSLSEQERSEGVNANWLWVTACLVGVGCVLTAIFASRIRRRKLQTPS